jgi:hypothetical protein
MGAVKASERAAENYRLLVDEAVHFADLARHFGRSEASVAGLIEAVPGDDTWAMAWHDEPALTAELENYQNGFMHGQGVVDALNGITA